MRKFSQRDFEAFFRQVDAELKRPCTIVLIGGAAVTLRFNGTHATVDIDLWTASEAGFWDAVAKVNAKAKVKVPAQKAAIAEPPYHFEDRLEPLKLPGLTKLKVLIPEAHDLVLMKVARGEAHDLDAIEDIHRAQPLDLDTLVERYREAVPQVIGSVEAHRLNFLAAVARLFGDERAEWVDELTKPNRHKGTKSP